MSESLAITLSLAFELPVVLLMVLVVWKSTARQTWMAVALAGVATVLTQPFAWMGNQKLEPMLEFPLRAAIIECIVIIAEGVLYSRLSFLGWRKGMWLSAVANVFSFFSGLAVYEFL